MTEIRRYTPELVKDQWESQFPSRPGFKRYPYGYHPLGYGSFDRITRRMSASGRVNSLLPVSSSNEYQGSWFYQDTEQICTPCTFATAHLIMRASPDYSLIAKLLNFANGDNEKGMQGMELGEMAELISQSGVSKVSLRSAEEDERFSLLTSMGGDQDNQRHNAKGVKKVLDQGKIPIMVVNNWIFSAQANYDPKDDFKHTICVAGYCVNEDGKIDLQVVDPGRGIFWTSMEHVYDAWAHASYQELIQEFIAEKVE